jgi:hypothetical protein
MGDLNNPNENSNEQQSSQNPDQSQYQYSQDIQPQVEQPKNDQPLYEQPQYQQQQYQQPQYQQTQYQQSGQSQNQGQYQQYQQYQQPLQPRKDNGMAIASMVCGIVSFVISCCLYYLALPLAIVSIVLAIMVLKNNKDGKGMAIAGLVLSGLTVLIALLAIIGCAAIAGNEDFINEIYEKLETTTY